MAPKSWHIAVAAVFPPALAAVYLMLWGSMSLVFGGPGFSRAAAMGMAGFVFFLLAVLVALIPAPFLATPRTRWVGAFLALPLGGAFLTLTTLPGLSLGWVRFILGATGLTLLAAGAWTVPEQLWLRPDPVPAS